MLVLKEKPSWLIQGIDLLILFCYLKIIVLCSLTNKYFISSVL